MKYTSIFFIIFGLLLTSFVVVEVQAVQATVQVEDEVSSMRMLPRSPQELHGQSEYETSTCDYIRDHLADLKANMDELGRRYRRSMRSHDAQISRDFRDAQTNRYNLKLSILTMIAELYTNRQKQGCP